MSVPLGQFVADTVEAGLSFTCAMSAEGHVKVPNVDGKNTRSTIVMARERVIDVFGIVRLTQCVTQGVWTRRPSGLV